MGWVVRNKSNESELAETPDGPRSVDPGEVLDLHPRYALPLVQGKPETWEKVMPNDPAYQELKESLR